MFSTDIIDTDSFLEMPSSSKCLYYDLGMRADDDGFVSPKKVVRLTGASEDDLKVLIAKKFIIPFKSGVIVIRDWKMNNYIQKDRYTETIYKEEKKLLGEDENHSYSLEEINDIQNVYKMDTQVRVSKELDKGTSTKVDGEPSAPKTYGNPDINDLISYLKEKMDIPQLDGSEQINRRYAYILLRKSKKGVDGVKWLIDSASHDLWFKAHITSFKDLWNNQMKIMAVVRKEVQENETKRAVYR